MTFTEQLILLIVPILLPAIISLSAVLYQRLVQGLPAKQQALVQQVVNTVVRAVEQEARNTLDGPGKKQAAMQMATNMLKSLHLNISQDVISSVIEAAVYALNQEQNKVPPISTTTPASTPTPIGTR